MSEKWTKQDEAELNRLTAAAAVIYAGYLTNSSLDIANSARWAVEQAIEIDAWARQYITEGGLDV